MTTLTLNVNRNATTREVAPEMLLIDFLRETLGLTGAHQGCNSTQYSLSHGLPRFQSPVSIPAFRSSPARG